MDTVREKLVGLLTGCGICFHCLPSGIHEEQEKRRIADHLIANGVTVQEWIPVTEGLPDPFETVWAHDATTGEAYAAYVTAHKEWNGVCKSHEITHWTRVPQMPKGE